MALARCKAPLKYISDAKPHWEVASRDLGFFGVLFLQDTKLSPAQRPSLSSLVNKASCIRHLFPFPLVSLIPSRHSSLPPLLPA